MPRSEQPPEEHRAVQRRPISWVVDCAADDTFLYASLKNISALGIFLRTASPLPIGTDMLLRFTPASVGPFAMKGCVQWINAVHFFGENLNPGMGVRFTEVLPDQRERLVSVVRTIVYLRGDPLSHGAN